MGTEGYKMKTKYVKTSIRPELNNADLKAVQEHASKTIGYWKGQNAKAKVIETFVKGQGKHVCSGYCCEIVFSNKNKIRKYYTGFKSWYKTQ